jgi:hypothetical protein
MANYVAFTAPINPAGSSPVLNVSQLWKGLQIKVGSAETFVGAAIESTDVLKTYKTEKTNLPVTEREVVFREGNRRVHETVIEYYPTKVEFHQKDGSKVMNILSRGAGGESDLYMTYTFEWLHPELEGDEAGLKEKRTKEEAMSKLAVESTIKVMRELVENGRIS